MIFPDLSSFSHEYVYTFRPFYIGFVQKYVERVRAQLEAARQDLRLRSGGGQGVGTAVAAVHASLRSSLNQVSADPTLMERGAFPASRLHEMGLDALGRPLPLTVKGATVEDDWNVNEALAQEREGEKVYNLHDSKKKAGKAKAEYEHTLHNDPTVMKVPLPNKYSPEQSQGGEDAGDVAAPASSSRNASGGVVGAREAAILERAAKESAKPLRCLRCHQLGNTGVTKGAVAAIRAADFVELLRSRFLAAGGRSSVIIKLVDIFDFHGSFIRDFKRLAGGRNPIVLVANKSDLLPRAAGVQRLTAWIRREAEKYDLHFYSVHVVSSTTGFGINELFAKVLSLARGENSPDAPRNRPIYVVGSTNVGKSTFINMLIKRGLIGTGLPSDVASTVGAVKHAANNPLDGPRSDSHEAADEAANGGIDGDAPDMDGELTRYSKRAGSSKGSSALGGAPAVREATEETKSLFAPLIDPKYLVKMHQEMLQNQNKATISPIPGTTLGVVSYPVLERKRGGKALTVSDTPGVLNSHQMTTHLHYAELRAVLPKAEVAPLTYRVSAGQSILIGGLARIDIVSGRPFFLACYFSPQVTVHITATKNITEDYLRRNLGTLLFPPFSMSRGEDMHVVRTLAVDQTEVANEAAIRERALAAAGVHPSEVDEAESEPEPGDRGLNLSGSEDAEDPEDGIPSLESAWRAKVAAHNRETEVPMASSAQSDSATTTTTTTSSAAGAPATTRLIPVNAETFARLNSPARSFIDNKGRILYQLKGIGWEEASHDIVLSGLGWIATCGSGPLTVRVALAGEVPDLSSLPDRPLTEEDVEETPELMQLYSRAHLRNPLMPYDIRASRYSGTPAAVKLTSGTHKHRVLERRHEISAMAGAVNIASSSAPSSVTSVATSATPSASPDMLPVKEVKIPKGGRRAKVMKARMEKEALERAQREAIEKAG